MKKLFIAFLMILTSSMIFSQVYVDGININDSGSKFCSVYASRGKVKLDYGQADSFISFKNYISDAMGNPIKFNSKIDVINHLEKNGWDLFQIIADTSHTKEFYFKKR
ncbi:MAG: hypothetical protein JXR68_08980 [Bacteroidales bacterium]|nr:hypothetical protein [Bacteroidales bacterium]